MSWGQQMQDGLRFLASPQYAFTEATIVVLLAARLMYRVGRSRSKLYWKGTAFAADILSIVGLIGLAAMAGRMLLDQDLRSLRDAEVHAGMALQSEQTDVLAGLCNPMTNSKPPTKAMAEAMELCNAVRSLGGIYRPEIDWNQTRATFSSLASGKPAGDVLASEAGKLVSRIDVYVDAKNKIPEAEWNNTEVPRLTSPWFVLTCLGFAALGLALKVARSAWEFREEGAVRRSS